MAKLISIYWRDIPAQVLGRAGRGKVRRELPARFQEAIDRAAMRAGRGSSGAYLDDWRRVTEQVSGDLDALVAQKAEALEAEFSEEYLERVIKNKGLTEGVDKE